MERGYIKLYRKVSDNKLWLSEPFTRGQAWIDMVLLANYKDGIIRVRGIRVTVLRGQLGWSEVRLAARWQWSRGKVRRFLKELKKDENIVQQESLLTTLITITNYDEYQGNSTADGTTDGTTDGQQTDSRRYPNKKGKKVKKGKKNKRLVLFDPEKTPEIEFYITKKKKKLQGLKLERFLIAWDAFGYKKGKADAADTWMDIKNMDEDIFKKITEEAKTAKEDRDNGDGPQIPQMFQGWLSGKRWEDEGGNHEDIYDRNIRLIRESKENDKVVQQEGLNTGSA